LYAGCCWQTIGTLAILREPLETLDQFEARAIDTAIEMHAPFVVFEGLPPTDSEDFPIVAR
jgi:hypothetical protein